MKNDGRAQAYVPRQQAWRAPTRSIVAAIKAESSDNGTLKVSVTLEQGRIFEALDLKPASNAETLTELQEKQERIADLTKQLATSGATTSELMRLGTERQAAQSDYMKHLIVLMLQQSKLIT